MRRTVLAFAVAALVVPGTLRAQGFGIFEQGTCAMGRGGTAVAAPCEDGSSIFFNPAGVAAADGWTLSVGVTGIVPTGEFTFDRSGRAVSLEESVVPVPHGYLTRGVTDRLSVGLGVYVPYGLETEWPEDFDGRFLGYENRLQSVYVQPTAAFRLSDRLTVGGGPVVAIGGVELSRRLDLSSREVPGVTTPLGGTVRFSELGIPHHTPFADASLEADGATGLGANVGIRYRATDRISVGARYLSRIELDYEGSARFEPVSTGLVLPANNPFGVPAGTSVDAVLQQAGVFSSDGPLADQSVSTRITMPDQAVAGVKVDASERLSLLGDVIWTNWSTFDSVRLDFARPETDDEVLVEDYSDTGGVRLGVEYRATPRWTLRGGYLYNEAAAPDRTVTPLLPEASRNQGTLGIGYRPTSSVRLNLAYQFLAQRDRRGRTLGPPPGEKPREELNNGVYSFDAHLFAGTVTLTF